MDIILIKRLNDLREEKDLSIAASAREIGVPARNLQYYFNGTYDFPLPILIDLANYFEVSLDYLVGRTNLKRLK